MGEGGGVKGRLELFQKFIDNGADRRPLKRETFGVDFGIFRNTLPSFKNISDFRKFWKGD